MQVFYLFVNYIDMYFFIRVGPGYPVVTLPLGSHLPALSSLGE